MDTFKEYTGTDVVLANAFRDLELIIFEASVGGFDARAAVLALNILIDRANG